MGKPEVSLLLDTHVWIWTQERPEQIGSKTRRRMERREEELFVSTYSSLELARLCEAERIELKGSLELWTETSLKSLHCAEVDLSREIALGAYQLPGEFHRDPVDRVLVATARVMGLTLVTADERILRYRKVKTLDART